jgi:hypothetical protein
MAKLIGTEVHGGRIDRYFLHTGDDGKDRITVQSTEDAEPLLEACQREYNAAPGRFEKKPGMRRIARFNETTLTEICRIHKISFRELMIGKSCRAQDIWNKVLNDPALRKFRTAPGRVDVRKTAG